MAAVCITEYLTLSTACDYESFFEWPRKSAYPWILAKSLVTMNAAPLPCTLIITNKARGRPGAPTSQCDAETLLSQRLEPNATEWSFGSSCLPSPSEPVWPLAGETASGVAGCLPDAVRVDDRLGDRLLTLPLTRCLLTCASEEDTFKAMSDEADTHFR